MGITSSSSIRVQPSVRAAINPIFAAVRPSAKDPGPSGSGGRGDATRSATMSRDPAAGSISLDPSASQPAGTDHADGAPEGIAALVRTARYHYVMHRHRAAMIGDLFGEPAWDMLLALFIARAEGRRTPVKNVCLESGTSTSTAMRRLDYLLAAGLLHKIDDSRDARRSLVELTERGYEVMVVLLQAKC